MAERLRQVRSLKQAWAPGQSEGLRGEEGLPAAKLHRPRVAGNAGLSRPLSGSLLVVCEVGVSDFFKVGDWLSVQREGRAWIPAWLALGSGSR